MQGCEGEQLWAGCPACGGGSGHPVLGARFLPRQPTTLRNLWIVLGRARRPCLHPRLPRDASTSLAPGNFHKWPMPVLMPPRGKWSWMPQLTSSDQTVLRNSALQVRFRAFGMKPSPVSLLYSHASPVHRRDQEFCPMNSHLSLGSKEPRGHENPPKIQGWMVGALVYLKCK